MPIPDFNIYLGSSVVKILACMLKKFLILSFVLPVLAHAQVSQDVTIPISVTVSPSPSVLLEWPNPAGGNLTLLRRTKGQSGTQWISLLNATGSTQSSYMDQNVVAGQTYEYALRRTTGIDAFGYAHAAVYAPVTDSRGKVMVVVDSATAGALAPDSHWAQALGLIAGLVTAGSVHAAKSTIRPVANVGTAGVAAPVLSVIEDGFSIVLSLVALLVPLLVVVLLGGLIVLLWRGARRVSRARSVTKRTDSIGQ